MKRRYATLTLAVLCVLAVSQPLFADDEAVSKATDDATGMAKDKVGDLVADKAGAAAAGTALGKYSLTDSATACTTTAYA